MMYLKVDFCGMWLKCPNIDTNPSNLVAKQRQSAIDLPSSLLSVMGESATTLTSDYKFKLNVLYLDIDSILFSLWNMIDLQSPFLSHALSPDDYFWGLM